MVKITSGMWRFNYALVGTGAAVGCDSPKRWYTSGSVLGYEIALGFRHQRVGALVMAGRAIEVIWKSEVVRSASDSCELKMQTVAR
jgi:hypothetical protein